MRDFIFRYRGWLFVPSGILMLSLAKPTTISLIEGLIISFVLGEGLRIWAVTFTGATTRDKEVKASQLITAGPYAYLRNPLYLGNLISWLGFCVAACGNASPVEKVVIFVSMISAYILIYGNIIPLEEEYLEKTFGESFLKYKESVPRIIPRFTPYETQIGISNISVVKTAEVHTLGMLAVIEIMLLLKFAIMAFFHI